MGRYFFGSNRDGQVLGFENATITLPAKDDDGSQITLTAKIIWEKI